MAVSHAWRRASEPVCLVPPASSAFVRAKSAYASCQVRRAMFAAVSSSTPDHGPDRTISTRTRSTGASAASGSRLVGTAPGGGTSAFRNSSAVTASCAAGSASARSARSAGRSAAVTREAIQRRSAASCARCGTAERSSLSSQAVGSTPSSRSRSAALSHLP
ncbi:hypothetical protein AN220_13400 [Streptomyces nanshensis]|nr:hypothetical protein AN220_13400 [Streptomyces nanshensis]